MKENEIQCCPLHRVPLDGDRPCFICELAGLHVVRCDPETAQRYLDAIEKTAEYVPDRSFAVLVFRKPGAHVDDERAPHVRKPLQPAATRRTDAPRRNVATA